MARDFESGCKLFNAMLHDQRVIWHDLLIEMGTGQRRLVGRNITSCAACLRDGYLDLLNTCTKHEGGEALAVASGYGLGVAPPPRRIRLSYRRMTRSDP